MVYCQHTRIHGMDGWCVEPFALILLASASKIDSRASRSHLQYWHVEDRRTELTSSGWWWRQQRLWTDSHYTSHGIAIFRQEPVSHPSLICWFKMGGISTWFDVKYYNVALLLNRIVSNTFGRWFYKRSQCTRLVIWQTFMKRLLRSPEFNYYVTYIAPLILPRRSHVHISPAPLAHTSIITWKCLLHEMRNNCPRANI